MSYTETLALARAHHIDIVDLIIADEVASYFGADHPQYERICEVVKGAYLKYEHLSENDICYALDSALQSGDVTLEDFLDYGDGYDKVIEDACYVGI